ncbi:MAG TPA: SDR family NAD(P)-dependent oxidoreductase [Solirubrobacteraceae bacterium]
MRFLDGVRCLRDELGVTRFLEIGPDRTLGALVTQSIEEETQQEGEHASGSGDRNGSGRASGHGTANVTGHGEGIFVAASMRPLASQAQTFLTALVGAHVHGVRVDWRGFEGLGTGRVELPAYAFQRRRYWLGGGAGVGDPTAAGQSAVEHPLLGAVVPLAGDGGGWLFTGRLSSEAFPWIADHAVMDTVLFPGTGFIDLVLAAGERVGAGTIDELTLEAPLVLGEHGARQFQLSVSAPDEDGCSRFAVHSRPQDLEAGQQDSADGMEWTRHATGVLAPSEAASLQEFDGFVEEAWPPANGRELDTEFFYDRLAEAGYNYGPTFQALRRAWIVDDAVYAEIAFDEDTGHGVAGFGVHPALLDSALHALVLGALDRAGRGLRQEPRVPFSFSGVQLYGRDDVTSLRIRLSGIGTAASGAGGATGSEALAATASGVESGKEIQPLSLLALDGSGAPALCVRDLKTRVLDRRALEGGGARGRGHDSLFCLDWVEISSAPANGSSIRAAVLGDLKDGVIEAAPGIELERCADLEDLKHKIETGAAPAPEIVLVRAQALVSSEGDADDGGTSDNGRGASPDSDRESSRNGSERDGGLVGAVHVMGARALELLQDFLSSDCLAEARLVLVSEGALAIAGGESLDLLQAPLVGLLRSAHSEHPEHFSMIDIDRVSTASLYGALRSEEPELAIRQNILYAPRLGRLPAQERGSSRELDPEGTILITGGTGGLGGLLARHLAAEHGARHLLLLSRSGVSAEGAVALRAELERLGCEARIEACDVTDRSQLEQLIASIPSQHPLVSVIHTAGVLDDGVIESLDGERLSMVMAPKVDAALHLHELTKDMELSEFILFSSFAGTAGSPGQGNYAAANVFLDALAHHRRTIGLPGLSLAFGEWERVTGVTGGLSEANRGRIGRIGMGALSEEQGLELIEVARGMDRSLLLLARLNRAALHDLVRAEMLPAIMRGLVRVPAKRSAEAGESLAKKLAGSPESEWDAIVLTLVKSQVASVLGHTSAEVIDETRGFIELGFDSLGAVELRNRLGQATDLKLPSTLVFDYPTPFAVSQYLRTKLKGQEKPTGGSLVATLEQLGGMISTAVADEIERDQITMRLRTLLSQVESKEESSDRAVLAQKIDSASDEELFQFFDETSDASELGPSQDKRGPS